MADRVKFTARPTTAELARYLIDRKPLTVAVLSLQAAERLADQPGIRLLIIGGESRPGERSHHHGLKGNPCLHS